MFEGRYSREYGSQRPLSSRALTLCYPWGPTAQQCSIIANFLGNHEGEECESIQPKIYHASGSLAKDQR
jgi:hypothetical protein